MLHFPFNIGQGFSFVWVFTPMDSASSQIPRRYSSSSHFSAGYITKRSSSGRTESTSTHATISPFSVIMPIRLQDSCLDYTDVIHEGRRSSIRWGSSKIREKRQEEEARMQVSTKKWLEEYLPDWNAKKNSHAVHNEWKKVSLMLLACKKEEEFGCDVD